MKGALAQEPQRVRAPCGPELGSSPSLASCFPHNSIGADIILSPSHAWGHWEVRIGVDSPPRGTALCSTVLQMCCRWETYRLPCCLQCPIALQIYIIYFLSLCHLLFLKDAELGTCNHSSPKIVEEPREPVSPEAMEGIQVTEVTHPCVGPWAGHGGCLCWGCWLTTEFWCLL